MAAQAEIIIVDCEMPEMNGICFIREVRLLERHLVTPIIMVTSHTEIEMRMEALAAGATDFVSKPVNASEFKLRVKNLLRLRAPAAA